MSKFKVLFKISGSIAAYKSCTMISSLVKDGHQVQVVCTKNALNFVGTSTLEGLSKRKVLTCVFESGHALEHIDLIKWADFTIFAPATGNSINKLAHGIADDLISSLFLAHNFKKPYFILPAMNTSMLQHPSTQKSIDTLKKMSIHVLPTGSGLLACGDNGEGKMLEPEIALKHIFTIVNNIERPTVLITAGGTSEPIDGVRFITNMSTGKTGATIADELTGKFNVTLLTSKYSVQPTNSSIKVLNYSSFSDIENSISNLLQNNKYSMIVHSAAISDYSVKELEFNNLSLKPNSKIKLPSDDEFSINLEKNPKIINKIKELAPNSTLFGFKLTKTTDYKEQQLAIHKLFKHSNSDYVVHNDLVEIENHKSHFFHIYDTNSNKVSIEGAKSLANFISNIYQAIQSPATYEPAKELPNDSMS